MTGTVLNGSVKVNEVKCTGNFSKWMLVSSVGGRNPKFESLQKNKINANVSSIRFMCESRRSSGDLCDSI